MSLWNINLGEIAKGLDYKYRRGKASIELKWVIWQQTGFL